MLKRLSFSNFAIIESADIPFRGGFTVLTGETGAGKSLIIDGLALLLGQRASTELIRAGEDKATIVGEFIVRSAPLSAILSSLDIPYLNDEVRVERVIYKKQSVSKVNGVQVTLNDLNRIARYLADIHSQFDFEKILNPENYLSIIDGFSPDITNSYKKDYAELLAEYRKEKGEYEALLAEERKLEENRDFYEYELKELEAADLKEGEEEEIEAELSLLRNYDKVYSLEQEADGIIHSDFLDKLYELDQTLGKLAEYQKQFEEAHAEVDDRYYELDDLFKTLRKDFASLDYDPSRLDGLEARDSDLKELKRKYKKSLDELIAYRDSLKGLLSKSETFGEDIAKKKAEMDEAFHKAFAKGKELSEVRRGIANSIEKELERSLKDLSLESRFEVRFNDAKEEGGDSVLKEDGLDEVDFLIETNVGEGLKSLSKVISGGEASRIMLAFKALFIKANKIPTVVFDEIDTGVSGLSASAVARKIKEISLVSQVIAITHLPQVASLSDHHILIEKEVRGERTYATVKELSLEEKIRQVAYLISGGKITEKQLDYAKEMVLGGRG